MSDIIPWLAFGEDAPLTPFGEVVKAAATEAQAKAFTERGLMEAIYILLRRNDMLQMVDTETAYHRGWTAGYEASAEKSDKPVNRAMTDAEAEAYRLGRIDERNAY